MVEDSKTTGIRPVFAVGWAALAAAAAVVAFLAGRRLEPSSLVEPEGKAAPLFRVLLEAETARPLAGAWTVVAMPAAGAERALTLAEGTLASASSALPPPQLTFELTRPNAVVLWLRSRWQDGCGNSVAVSLNNSPPIVVGNDGTYRAWHWVRGPVFNLGAGRHRLALLAREDGIAVDQVLLTSDHDAYPRGVLAGAPPPPAGVARSGAPPPSSEPSPASAPPGPSAAADRLPAALPALDDDVFRAGVAGIYRSGFESALLRLGVPCERLAQRDLVDAGALGRYDLLCLSDPLGPAQDLVRNLRRYAEEGGTLVLEQLLSVSPPPRAPGRRPLLPESLLPLLLFQVNRCTLAIDHSPFFAGEASPQIPLAPDVFCHYIPPNLQFPGTQVFGDVVHRGYRVGGALLKARLGRGVLYYGAVPFGFNSMWRGTRLDGILRNILLDAIANRHTPVFAALHPDLDGYAAVDLFADDFMRREDDGIGSAWTVEAGSCRCTGAEPQRPREAFSLKVGGAGSVAAGNPAWRDYRIAAAVLPRGVGAGVWAATGAGHRMALLLDQSPPRLRLVRVAGGRGVDLTAVPAPARGRWRRLSLLHRDGQWEGWLDGQRLLRGVGSGPVGRFGLMLESGQALFDDVAVVATAALIRGTDRCLGEEGSAYARPSISKESIEIRNISSPLWLIRPTGRAEPSVQLRLPTYAPGTLICDNAPPIPVAPAPDGARIALPPGGIQGQRLDFVTAGWHDYAFSARVTDWYSRDADWSPMPRWSCDATWHWLGVDTRTRSVLWYKHKLKPPYCINALMAVCARQRYRAEWNRGRDLNLVVAGDGRTLNSGYLFRVMKAGGAGSRLEHGGRVLDEARGIGLPFGHALHHVWWELRAVVEPRRIRLYLDGHLLFDHRPATPLPAAYIGLWTENDNIQVARATVSAPAHDRDTVWR